MVSELPRKKKFFFVEFRLNKSVSIKSIKSKIVWYQCYYPHRVLFVEFRLNKSVSIKSIKSKIVWYRCYYPHRSRDATVDTSPGSKFELIWPPPTLCQCTVDLLPFNISPGSKLELIWPPLTLCQCTNDLLSCNFLVQALPELTHRNGEKGSKAED